MSTLTVIMSPPDHFAIEYSINPWMNTENKVHPEHARREWEALKATYERFGASVALISPVQGLPDLVFTTDHGKFLRGKFYAARFRYKERQKEQDVVLPWYRAHGYEVIEPPANLYMEGGDIQVNSDKIFVGYGYRTGEETVSYLAKETGMEAIPLHLVDDTFYHLDTCFLPLGDAAFYYPTAFNPESIKKLRTHFTTLIPLTSAEAERFAGNSVELDEYVLCQPNPSFEQKLIDLGKTPMTLEMHEFNKSGGGLHCLSQIMT